MILLLFVLAVAAVACYSLFINRIKGLPPGPPPLPLGNLLQFEQDMDNFNLLQERIVKDGDKFSDRINPKELMNLILGGEYGLAFNDNNMWKEQRRFALHALRNVGFNNATIQGIAIRYSQEIIARWTEQGAGKQPVGVSNIIWYQTFGRTLPYDDPLFMRVRSLTAEFLVWMSHPVVLGMELIPSLRHLDRLFGSPIKKLSECNDKFLKLLDEINYPDVQRKAQREIDEKIGNRTIQMEDQKVLHYCNAVIQEVLRLSNILSMNFTRMVNEPVNIEGYNIPVGIGVIPEFAMVHMDESEFERPDYFCPERHLNELGEFVKDPRITPFSLGKRSCLGEGLARIELFLFFTSFIQHLTFSSVSKVLKVQINFARIPDPYEVLVEAR